MFASNGEPRLIRLPYESAEPALTPSEKEVALRIGGALHTVMVSDNTLDTDNRTIQVSVLAHPERVGTYLVDLGGDSVGTFRRVEVAHEVLAPFLK